MNISWPRNLDCQECSGFSNPSPCCWFKTCCLNVSFTKARTANCLANRVSGPQPNWHVDFLQLIGENYRRMVIPQITGLDIDTWTQIGSGGGMSKCYLTWDGDFKWGGATAKFRSMKMLCVFFFWARFKYVQILQPLAFFWP